MKPIKDLTFKECLKEKVKCVERIQALNKQMQKIALEEEEC